MPCWIWWSLGQPKRVGKESSYLSNKWHICHRRNYNWLWFTVLHVRFPQHMEHSSENNENEWRQLLFIPMNSFLRQNISKRELALEHVAHQFAWQLSNWFGLTNRQSSCLSDQSVTKTTIFAPLWGSHLLGKRNEDSLPTEGASATMCTAFCGKPFSPQHSAIHQWLQQSYWAFTRHLHIPDKRNKKHFKATLPAVPTLFHLSNTYKTVEEGQMLLRGATAHLLPASTLLNMLLFIFLTQNTL